MICKFIHVHTKAQAAILAVILITGVALVSAGFAAFVANSIYHARTLTGKASGKDLAMYGIEYAMQQFLTRPEGADWQPISDPNLPWDSYEKRRGWDNQYAKLSAPNGYFLLRISRRPDGYIEIDSIGRPEQRSPIYHRIIAVIPMPIIQYARFLGAVNPYGLNDYVFGIGQIDFDGSGTPGTIERNSCLMPLNGGIFVNDNFGIASGSLIKLFFDRNNPNNGLFVAGSVTVSSAYSIELCDESGNLIDPQRQPQDSNSSNFWIFPLNGVPRFRDGIFRNSAQLVDNISIFRRLQPIYPPIVDAQKYRKICQVGTNKAQVIYIGNKKDIQDNIWNVPQNLKPPQAQFWDWVNVPNPNDPADVRRRTDPKSGWYINAYDNDGDGKFDEDPVDNVDNDGDNKTDEDPISATDPYRRNPVIDNTIPDYMRYVPPGCEIELYQQGSNYFAKITRHDDPDNDGRIWEDRLDGSDNDGDGKIDEDPPPFDIPINSDKVVIFAEGNVRIKGTANASLTVISMGTIYIEGSLQTVNPPNQHIALLAKHNVCLNTTALLPVIESSRKPTTLTIAPDDMQFWDNDIIPSHCEFAAVPGPPLPSITWRIPVFDNSGQKMNVTLLHSGLGDLSNYCFIRLTKDGTAYQGEPMHFDPDNDGKIGEDSIDNQDNDGDGRIDEDWGQSTRCYMTGASHGIYWLDKLQGGDLSFSITAGVLDADNDNDKQIDEDPINGINDDGDNKIDEDPKEVPYRLSRFKIELLDANDNPIPLWNIRVNATIYAENGCFFILPPPYFDLRRRGKEAERFRRFNYFDIEIQGAISEYINAETMARSIGLTEAIYRTALDKLAYPKYDANGNLTGWQLVKFKYDPTLVQNPPPFLPVPPRPIIIYSGL